MIQSGLYIGDQIQQVLSDRLPLHTIVTLEFTLTGPRFLREPAIRSLTDQIESQYADRLFLRGRSWTANQEDPVTLTFEVLENPIWTLALLWKIIVTIVTLLFLVPTLQTARVELPRVTQAVSTGLQATGFLLPVILVGLGVVFLSAK